MKYQQKWPRWKTLEIMQNKKDITCHYLTISCLIILTIEESRIKNQISS